MKFTTILCTLLLLLFAVDSFAGGLRVVPHRIHIKAKERVVPITLTNTSDIRKAYRISFETRYMKEEGGTYLVGDSVPFSAVPNLRVSPRRVILGVGERQIIRLQVRSRNLDDGDYFAHIKFTEVKIPKSLTEIAKDDDKLAETGGGMGFRIGTAVNLVLPITVTRGKVETKVKITSVIDNGFMQGITKFLDAMVTRVGNGQGKGYFYGRFKSNNAIEGETLPVVIHRAPLNIYRNIDKHLVHLPISNEDVLLKNGKLIVTLHSGESVSSKVLDTYILDIP